MTSHENRSSPFDKSDARRRPSRRPSPGLVAAMIAALMLVTAIAAIIWVQVQSRPPEWAVSAYRAGISQEWERLEALYPFASRPEADFVRFVSDAEYPAVTLKCLDEQGVSGEIDEYGISASPPAGQEQKYALAWFACDTTYPLQLTKGQAYVPALMRDTYRYFGETLIPCLEQRDHEIADLPGYAEFRKRWWTDDPWSPYRFIDEPDADQMRILEEACPPTPTFNQPG